MRNAGLWGHGSVADGAAASCSAAKSFGSSRSLATKASTLRRLEGVANRRPQDAAAQEEYLFALNSGGFHSEVVRRVQSGQFAVNPYVELERLRAVSRMDARTRGSPSLAESQASRRLQQGGEDLLGLSAATSSFSSSMGNGGWDSLDARRAAADGQYRGAESGGRMRMEQDAESSNGSDGGSGGGATLGTPDAPMHMQFVSSRFERTMRVLQAAVSIAIGCFLIYTLVQVGSNLTQGKGGGGL